MVMDRPIAKKKLLHEEKPEPEIRESTPKPFFNKPDQTKKAPPALLFKNSTDDHSKNQKTEISNHDDHFNDNRNFTNIIVNPSGPLKRLPTKTYQRSMTMNQNKGIRADMDSFEDDLEHHFID